MKTILKYFPETDAGKKEKIEKLQELYSYWNEKINVISRKDIDLLYERHVLHSLSIAKFMNFVPGTKILDVGTGGGFPGIPLAIFFPEVSFYLADSIGKKIKIVNEISKSLDLKNVHAKQTRVEKIDEHFDFVISRAVTAFPKFVSMVKKRVGGESKNENPNGIIYLKGGDFKNEIIAFRNKVQVINIKDYFEEVFFDTKKIIYLPG